MIETGRAFLAVENWKVYKTVTCILNTFPTFYVILPSRFLFLTKTQQFSSSPSSECCPPGQASENRSAHSASGGLLRQQHFHRLRRFFPPIRNKKGQEGLTLQLSARQGSVAGLEVAFKTRILPFHDCSTLVLLFFTEYISTLLNMLDANKVMLWKLESNLVTECC